MARHRFRVTMPAKFTTTADGAYYTILQAAAGSSNRIALLDFWISGFGVSSTAPHLMIELARTSGSAGTATAVPSANVEELEPELGITKRGTFKYTFTAEDASIDAYLFRDALHPQGKYVWTLGHQAPIIIPESGRLSLRVMQGAAETPVALIAGMTLEE